MIVVSVFTLDCIKASGGRGGLGVWWALNNIS